MAAPKRARPGAPLEAVVRHVEHEPPGAVAREEFLDRLSPLAAGARRTHDGAERDQRRAEIAALCVAGCRGSDVSTDGGATTHFAVRDMASDLREHLVWGVNQRGDRDHRPDRDAVVVDAQASSPDRWSISARSGFTLPIAISGSRIVPPANTVIPAPSP